MMSITHHVIIPPSNTFWDQKLDEDIHRRYSMILTFHVPPLARGQGLRSIYSAGTFRKIIKKWEIMARRNKTNLSKFTTELKKG